MSDDERFPSGPYIPTFSGDELARRVQAEYRRRRDIKAMTVAPPVGPDEVLVRLEYPLTVQFNQRLFPGRLPYRLRRGMQAVPRYVAEHPVVAKFIVRETTQAAFLECPFSNGAISMPYDISEDYAVERRPWRRAPDRFCQPRTAVRTRDAA